MIRRLVAGLVLALLALAALAHWLYWYRPRARPAAPADSALLAAAPAHPVLLWLPYPHQNLGALEREVEDAEALLGALARLAGLPPPALPRLEPVGVPPARELLVAADTRGERVVVELLPYPTVRVVSRLAGGLAGNPWLAGGTVEAGRRPAEVRWEGAIWRAVRGEAPARSVPAPGLARDVAPVLALLELTRASPPLPAGRYRLIQDGADLALSLGERPPREEMRPRQPLRDTSDLVLLFLRRGEGGGLEALALFDRESGLVPGLPAAAVLAASRDGERLLPGGRALRRLTRLPAERGPEGTLLATDAEALQRARELLPLWRELAAAQAGRGELATGAWMALKPAAVRSRRILGFLERFPLTPSQELQRWQDLTLLLETAARRYVRVEGWATVDGVAAELRLGT